MQFEVSLSQIKKLKFRKRLEVCWILKGDVFGIKKLRHKINLIPHCGESVHVSFKSAGPGHVTPPASPRPHSTQRRRSLASGSLTPFKGTALLLKRHQFRAGLEKKWHSKSVASRFLALGGKKTLILPPQPHQRFTQVDHPISGGGVVGVLTSKSYIVNDWLFKLLCF